MRSSGGYRARAIAVLTLSTPACSAASSVSSSTPTASFRDSNRARHGAANTLCTNSAANCDGMRRRSSRARSWHAYGAAPRERRPSFNTASSTTFCKSCRLGTTVATGSWHSCSCARRRLPLLAAPTGPPPTPAVARGTRLPPPPLPRATAAAAPTSVLTLVMAVQARATAWSTSRFVWLGGVTMNSCVTRSACSAVRTMPARTAVRARAWSR